MRSYPCHGTSLSLIVAPKSIQDFSAQDNTKFVSSGGDRTLFYWDVSTGQTIRRIAAHNGKIPAVSLNDDASVVVSGECEDKIEVLHLFVLCLAHRIIRHECEDMGP